MKNTLATALRTGLAAILASGSIASQAADVRSFRSDYNTVLDSLQQTLEQTGNTRSLGLLKQARTSLSRVSDQDFNDLFGGSGLPDLGETAGMLRQSMSAPRAKSAGFPQPGGIHEACPGIGYSSQLVYEALVAAQVTSSVLAAATFVCTQDILGENGSAACIPLAIADDIAQGIFATRSWCAGESDSAVLSAANDRLDHVHNDLADARSTILSNQASNLTSILTNLSDTKTAINTSITNTQNALNTAINASTATTANNIVIAQNNIISNANANQATTTNNINASTTTVVNTTNAARDAMIGELRMVACEIIRLLNTPDGQRSSSIAACTTQPGFPYSWNKR